MRAELFAKDIASCVSSTLSLHRLAHPPNLSGVNLPNKARDVLRPLPTLRALAAQLPPDILESFTPHYSLKFNYAGSAPATISAFHAYCHEAHALRVRQMLLVSGSGSRSVDSIACLRSLSESTPHPEIGVAFNPYFPERAARERERARLKQKLVTGRVAAVWLQIGTDLQLLSEGLNFLANVSAERGLQLRLYGSIFVPTRRLLAAMKFRPWNGVFLSAEYTSSVEGAERITREITALYHERGVEVLVESAINNDADWAAAARLATYPEALHADAEDRAALERLDTTSAVAAAAPASVLTADELPTKRMRAEPLLQPPTSIVWYRDFDLRLGDHKPLAEAARRGAVVPAFVWPVAKEHRGELPPGGAAQAWLEESLEHLDNCLSALESRLIVRRSSADVASELAALAEECGAKSVFFHRAYTPDGSRDEASVSAALASRGIDAVSLAGHLLYEPSQVDMDAGYAGGHWGTLMPFLRSCERSGPAPARPLPPPSSLSAPSRWPSSVPIASLGLAPAPVGKDGVEGRRWAKEMMSHWRVGELSALEAADAFVNGNGLSRYEFDRSRADRRGTVSTLSPYLRFGQLSVRQLYHAVRAAGLERELTKTFSRRLHWRDLAYYQLHCFPRMTEEPIRAHYASHRWSSDPQLLKAWQRGRTGYPMVDAGMRCLYATGWMHQSVRMVTASFLVEYLGISWVEGARWFHDTLVDADVAINAMMWQNAGRSGIDQWNFVLSPETGSQDGTGEYCRRWLPELSRLPTKYLHTPWRAPPEVLKEAGVELGVTYPERVVDDLSGAREKTVEALLDARRSAMHANDAGGYDLIELPTGQLTRVFTKQEFRLDSSGAIKPGKPKALVSGRGRGRGRRAAAGRGSPAGKAAHRAPITKYFGRTN